MWFERNGSVLISMAGVPHEMKSIMDEWATDDAYMFKTKEWWAEHIAKNCEEDVEVNVYESANFDLVWQEWFDSGHEYGVRDKEYLERGLKDILNFVMMVIRKKEK